MGIQTKCSMIMASGASIDPLLIGRGNLPPSNPFLTIPKDNKMLFEPEVNVKTEPIHSAEPSEPLPDETLHSEGIPPETIVPEHVQVDYNSEHLQRFTRNAKKIDPILLWGVLKPKVLNHVSLWDFLVDKTLIQAQTISGDIVPSDRLNIMLTEVTHLLELVSEILEHCCESQIKIEDQKSNLTGNNENVVVPEKLLPVVLGGLSKNVLNFKNNVDLTRYERLFSFDEALSEDLEDDVEDIKEEDDEEQNFENLDNEELDLIDFALDHEDVEEEVAEDPADFIWKPAKPDKIKAAKNPKKVKTPKTAAKPAPKKPSAPKPRQCEKVRISRPYFNTIFDNSTVCRMKSPLFIVLEGK